MISSNTLTFFYTEIHKKGKLILKGYYIGKYIYFKITKKKEKVVDLLLTKEKP